MYVGTVSATLQYIHVLRTNQKWRETLRHNLDAAKLQGGSFRAHPTVPRPAAPPTKSYTLTDSPPASCQTTSRKRIQKRRKHSHDDASFHSLRRNVCMYEPKVFSSNESAPLTSVVKLLDTSKNIQSQFTYCRLRLQPAIPHYSNAQ